MKLSTTDLYQTIEALQVRATVLHWALNTSDSAAHLQRANSALKWASSCSFFSTDHVGLHAAHYLGAIDIIEIASETLRSEEALRSRLWLFGALRIRMWFGGRKINHRIVDSLNTMRGIYQATTPQRVYFGKSIIPVTV